MTQMPIRTTIHPVESRRLNLRSKGFTLIELMVTVAIIGILGAIAYPSYRDSILKGRRAEARSAVMGLLQQQERYATQNGQYLAFSSGATDTPFKTFSGDSGRGQARYLLSAGTCSDAGTAIRDCVKISASPVSADPEAGAIWVQSSGAKGCDGTKPQLCWP